MSNRIKGVIVTFDDDYREEEAQKIMNAIVMITGILAVDSSTRDHNDIMNRRRIESYLKDKLWDAFNDQAEGEKNT